MQTTIPSEHQALGRKAKGFNRGKWDERECLLLPSALLLGLSS